MIIIFSLTILFKRSSGKAHVLEGVDIPLMPHIASLVVRHLHERCIDLSLSKRTPNFKSGEVNYKQRSSKCLLSRWMIAAYKFTRYGDLGVVEAFVHELQDCSRRYKQKDEKTLTY